LQTRERTRANGHASTPRGNGNVHSKCTVHFAEETCHRCSQQILEVLGAVTKFCKVDHKFEFIGKDKDRQLESLWKDTEIGNMLPWEDIEDEQRGC
jgi:hypothetical protein